MSGKIRLAVDGVGLDPSQIRERLGKAKDAAIAKVCNVEIARRGIDGETHWKAESFRPDAIWIRLAGTWLAEDDGRGVAILKPGNAGPGKDSMIEGIGHVEVAVAVHSHSLRRGKRSGADHVHAVLAKVGLPKGAVGGQRQLSRCGVGGTCFRSGPQQDQETAGPQSDGANPLHL